MNYFNIVLTTFQGLELFCFIKNTLIWVPKINKGLTDLEWHEGE